MNFVMSRDTRMLYYCPEHTHENWELIRQSYGKARAYVDGKAFELSEGDLLLVPPNTSHSCENDELFGDMYISFSTLNMPLTPLLIHDLDGNIGNLMKMIIKLHTEKESYHNEIIESLLEAILFYLRKSVDVKITYPFVNDFKEILYKNLDNSDFDIGSTISKLGYHPDYFRRCFKKELGKSPLEYLTSLRISKAMELLVQNDFLGVENVAVQCGFSDSFYFSTCFKKHNGLAPLAYRKKRLSEKH